MSDALTDLDGLRRFTADLLASMEEWGEYEGGPSNDELRELRDRARKLGVKI